MKKRLRIVIPVLLILLFSYIVFRYFSNSEDQSFLTFSGNIEVTESQMSFRIPGHLSERLAAEGDRVQTGQILAKLDKSTQIIASAQAEANQAYAEAVLAELVAGSRQEDIARADAKVMQARYSLTELQNGSRREEIESAKAAVESARAAEQSAIVQLKQANSNYKRYANLRKDGSVSENVFETYQTLLETAESKVKEAGAKTMATTEQLQMLEAGPRIEQIHRAEAALKQAEAEYALIKAGPRKESLDQARAKLKAAEESAKQAKLQLSYTELIAPMDAVVLSAPAEIGEYLNPAAPVLTLGKLNEPWLRAYINEKDLGRIKLQQKVKVTTDSYPDKIYIGRIGFISSEAEFTPKTVQTFEERVKLMFRIKVLLENPDNELKPGMPADGKIDLTDQ